MRKLIAKRWKTLRKVLREGALGLPPALAALQDRVDVAIGKRPAAPIMAAEDEGVLAAALWFETEPEAVTMADALVQSWLEVGPELALRALCASAGWLYQRQWDDAGVLRMLTLGARPDDERAVAVPLRQALHARLASAPAAVRAEACAVAASLRASVAAPTRWSLALALPGQRGWRAEATDEVLASGAIKGAWLALPPDGERLLALVPLFVQQDFFRKYHEVKTDDARALLAEHGAAAVTALERILAEIPADQFTARQRILTALGR